MRVQVLPGLPTDPPLSFKTFVFLAMIPTSFDQILPSIEAMGVWAYWVIGLSALLEGMFLTGMFVPGVLLVITGGVLVQAGSLDFFDLVWFVALGSALGGEISFMLGRRIKIGLAHRWDFERSTYFSRADNLFRRHGGGALVLGRFLGPVSGFVSLAAAFSDMPRRKVFYWTIASGFPYAISFVALGYFFGDVLAQVGPIASRIALFLAGSFAILALLWWLTIRVTRMMPVIWSILRSIGFAVAENPDVRSWGTRHPTVIAFIRSRIRTNRFSGLTASLLGVAFAYVAIIWTSSVLDFLFDAQIAAVDSKLASLAHSFWTPSLIQFFAFVTALGDIRILGPAAAAVFLTLWAAKRHDLILGLSVSLAGDLVSVTVLKRIFHRERPELAWFRETSGSFPSGHAALSVAFYAMVFYVLWRCGVLRPVRAAILAVTIAFLLGLSRIYLIEHYLSDVINGWLVGSLWLLIGISVAEWWRETRPGDGSRPSSAGINRATIGTALLLVAVAVWQLSTFDKARAIIPQEATNVVATDVATLFANGTFPVTTESLLGRPLEPINAVLRAKSEPGLVKALSQAGWNKADQPSVGSLIDAALALVQGADDTTAPVTPYFWWGEPNQLAFQKQTPEQTLKKRHHVRIWVTPYIDQSGNRIFVAAASFDDGLDWQLLHHVDPNVDAERDRLASDLKDVDQVDQLKRLQLAAPRMGATIAGDPWFSDGAAVDITLRDQSGQPPASQ
ncbi:MAG: LssY C-terminal domain-containing protein [Brevirhabdus sp.]